MAGKRGPKMPTGMRERDCSILLDMFDAQSRRGEPGHNDRKCPEALRYFMAHNINWQALQANCAPAERLHDEVVLQINEFWICSASAV